MKEMGGDHLPVWVWQAIEDGRWLEETLAKLTNYARGRLERLYGVPGFRQHAGEPLDYALKAAEKVIDGRRAVPSKVTNREELEGFLFDVVASVINNEFRAYLRALHSVGTPITEADDDTLGAIPDPRGQRIPDEVLFDLWRLFQDEPELIDVVDAYADGATTPQDIAFVLDITVDEANNRIKRIRRRVRREEEEGSGERSREP